MFCLSQWSNTLEDPSVWFLWLMTLQACEGGGYLYEAQFLIFISPSNSCPNLTIFSILDLIELTPFQKNRILNCPFSCVNQRKNCLGAIQSWIWVVEFACLELYPLAMRLWFCVIALSREDPKNQVRVFDIFAAVFFRFSNGCW